MDINKFIEETSFYEELINDFDADYSIEDIKEFVSYYPEYWEDASPKDFEELLFKVKEYILDVSKEEEKAWLFGEINGLINKLFKHCEYCSWDDINDVLKEILGDE